jgi:hypothetical protein
MHSLIICRQSKTVINMNILDKLEDISSGSEEFREVAEALRLDVGSLVRDKLAHLSEKIVSYVGSAYGGALEKKHKINDSRVFTQAMPIILPSEPYVRLRVNRTEIALGYIDSIRTHMTAIAWQRPNVRSLNMDGIRLFPLGCSGTKGKSPLLYCGGSEVEERDIANEATKQLIETGKSPILETIVRANSLMDDLMAQGNKKAKDAVIALQSYT